MATFPEALNGYNAATPADNTPAGTDSVGTQLDDHLRDIKANVKNAGALTPSSTATAAVTMAATDFNKLLLVDPSAAARTVSVLTAAAALEGFRVVIKNVSGANNVIVHRSGSNTIDGEASITLSATNQAVMLACNGTTWYRTSARTPITAATLTTTRGFISGLTLSNDSDADHDIAIAVGVCRDSAEAQNLVLPTIMTKRIDGSWAAGDDDGGLFTGSVATDTWYHVFLIQKTSDGSIDAGFDTSVTAANIPAGYSGYRRIGSVKTDDSSNIKPFVQFGDRFTWSAPTIDATDVATSDTAVLTTLNTPLAVKVEAEVYAHLELAGSQTRAILFSDPDVPDLSADSNLARASGYVQVSGSSTTNNKFNFVATCPTNTSSQIRVVNSATGGTYSIRTRSYQDYRGAV